MSDLWLQTIFREVQSELGPLDREKMLPPPNPEKRVALTSVVLCANVSICVFNLGPPWNPAILFRLKVSNHMTSRPSI